MKHVIEAQDMSGILVGDKYRINKRVISLRDL